ncbi:Transmembrane protein 231 [Frankliniella fusca]|uniref:Transmembrane protein 231 n=1 Tax=Frankliniella fusca TaxID=407009 RepID=A0AAE1LCU7_9NEOP|nr:Transmembrane protein 231 [Frankliniella fusca]
MAVFEVFTQHVSYRYKTTLCSKATIVFAICTALATFVPLIISYRSIGFWLKSDTYQEQPDIKFTHDYLLLLQTDIPHNSIQCRAQFTLTDNFQRHCLFKTREEDTNHDGKVDFINVNIQVPLLQNESVYSVTLILTIDFQISSIVQLKMKSLVPFQHVGALPGAGLSAVADLKFTQKKPVDYRITESLFRTTLLQPDNSLQDLFITYSQRNYSTGLTNLYKVWDLGRDLDKAFFIKLRISVPECLIVYRPGFWQVIKWAWMQYLSIFIVIYRFLQVVQEYVFSNQLVPTFKFVPWKTL